MLENVLESCDLLIFENVIEAEDLDGQGGNILVRNAIKGGFLKPDSVLAYTAMVGNKVGDARLYLVGNRSELIAEFGFCRALTL